MAEQFDKYSPFPSFFDSKEKKATPEYGLEYAKAIWSQYVTSPLQFNTDRQRYVINRQYAAGLESIQKYKDRKGLKGTSYLNLDFSPVNVIATKVDDIVGKLMKLKFKIQCESLSPESRTKFDSYKDKLRANILLKQIDKKHNISGRTGIPLVPENDNSPENEDELELHLKLNYKEDVSIAMEEALQYVFDSNNFDNTRRQILRDLVVNNKACIHWYYDENKNIRIDYIDVADIIVPYSKYDDFRNIPYFSYLESLTIGQLAELHPELTDEELYEIARSNEGKNANPRWQVNWGVSYEGYYAINGGTGYKPYYNFNIKALNFWFKSANREAREVVSHRNRTYVNNVKDKKLKGELIESECEYLYRGKWIPETTKIIGYGMVENIERPKIAGNYSPKAELPFAMVAPDIYDMQNKSLVERMIPYEDQINLANLTFQMLLIKAKPPGIAIDIVGLIDVAKGLGDADGAALKPMDVVRIYEETGNYIYSSTGSESGFSNNKAITELQGGISRDLESLLKVHQYYRQLINEVIGDIYAQTNAQAPSEQLVGVQQNAIDATNNALATLYDAHLGLIKKTAQRVSLQIQDCIEYDNEAFVNAIGQYSADILKVGKNLALSELGIDIYLMPDERQKARIEQLIQLGVQGGLLTPSDILRVEEQMETDVKLAGQLLAMLESKNQKAAQDAKNQDVQNNMQSQMQSTQVASQLKQQEIQLETQAKIQLLQAEWQLKGQYSQTEFQQQMELQRLKNVGSNTDSEIAAGGKVNVQQAANQGKIVAQQIDQNTQITKTHIVHHSDHTKIEHQKNADLELMENESPEKKEEKDKKEKRYIVGKKAYKESVLRKQGHDISKLKEYK